MQKRSKVRVRGERSRVEWYVHVMQPRLASSLVWSQQFAMKGALPVPPLDLTAISLLYYKRRPMHMTSHQNDMLTGKASLTPVIMASIKSLTTQSGMWTHHQSAVISAWWCRKRSGEQKVNELYMCRKEARCACVKSRESSEWEMDSQTAWKIRLICGSKRFRTVIRCLGALTNKNYGPEYGVIHQF
jgi:hypothetical protein